MSRSSRRTYRQGSNSRRSKAEPSDEERRTLSQHVSQGGLGRVITEKGIHFRSGRLTLFDAVIFVIIHAFRTIVVDCGAYRVR